LGPATAVPCLVSERVYREVGPFTCRQWRSPPPRLAYPSTALHNLLQPNWTMDLPGQPQSALGSACRIERRLLRGGMASA
jgi:hypothetical protein